MKWFSYVIYGCLTEAIVVPGSHFLGESVAQTAAAGLVVAVMFGVMYALDVGGFLSRPHG